jgi:hypothetical protein
MKEFFIGQFMDPFTNKVNGSCAGKNIDGLVEIHASDKELVDQLIEILSESSARNEIPLEGSGMEYILYRLNSMSAQYSSDGQVTEDMYEDAIKSLLNKKSFKA